MKKRVLIVHNYYQISGGEDTVVSNEKRLLEEHGHEVILYSRNNSELKKMSILKKVLLPLITVFNIRTYWDVRRIIKEKKIEIVHVHNTLTLISPSVYYAAFSCHVPVVQTVHNFRLLCSGATFYRDGHICEDCCEDGLICSLKHKCYRNSFLQTLAYVVTLKIHRCLGTYKNLSYICLTEFNKEKLLQLNRSKKQIINPDRVFIKPNFTFSLPLKNQDSREYFIFIGRIEEIKGIQILLSAFQQLPEERLIVIGNGLQFEYYNNMKDLKKLINVTFLGYKTREEINEYLSKSKAIIVPSQWYEGFPMVITEAYANSVPALVGEIGNIISLIVNNVTGKGFRYNSADALVKCIKEFNENDRELMGVQARYKYEKEFSPDANYRSLSTIYQVICGRRKIF